MSFKIDSQRGGGIAGAEAVSRNLGGEPASGRRAFALRPGGARRPALERPARRFPHRSAGSGQGAAGEERHHRAGRRQGRLLSQAPAARAARPAFRKRASRRTRHSCAACSTSPTTSSATAIKAPRACGALGRRRRLSRRRRRQGHGHLLRHRQFASPPNTAIGWAMRSRAAARSATTTRPWASPPRARGKR